jgi:hypothetical protein
LRRPIQFFHLLIELDGSCITDILAVAVATHPSSSVSCLADTTVKLNHDSEFPS